MGVSESPDINFHNLAHFVIRSMKITLSDVAVPLTHILYGRSLNRNLQSSVRTQLLRRVDSVATAPMPPTQFADLLQKDRIPFRALTRSRYWFLIISKSTLTPDEVSHSRMSGSIEQGVQYRGKARGVSPLWTCFLSLIQAGVQPVIL